MFIDILKASYRKMRGFFFAKIPYKKYINLYFTTNMKHLLFITFFLYTAFNTFAQTSSKFAPDNYTAYRKDQEALFKITENFILENKNLFVTNDIDSTKSWIKKTDSSIVVFSKYYMEMPKNFCWGSMYLSTEINFRIKNEKIRIEFNNIQFDILPPGGKSKCVTKGNYNDLLSLDCCKSVQPIDNFLISKFSLLRTKFKKHLIVNKNEFDW